MKKWSCGVIYLMLSAACFAQADSLRAKKYRHEFGTDAIGFVRFLTYRSENGNVYYAPLPTYYLNYRFKFRHSGLRAGIGGNYSNGNMDDHGYMVPFKLKEIEKRVNLRIGWEFTSLIAKRFEAYYGLDLKESFLKNRRDGGTSNGGYFYGGTYQTNQMGATAFFGIRFILSERVSFNTDLDYGFFFQKTTDINTFIPVNGQFPPKPNDIRPIQTKYFTEFRSPYLFNFNLSF